MASPKDDAHSGRQAKKATASGWIGSALEYYDFFIYAQAAALIFPQLFFPSGNPKVAIIASLATYGVGYVARPIGAFVLGHLGDTHGRKNVLLICMFLMGFSTMAVGLLPTYHSVGMLAPALLVVLRLVQGFAVAGEISGASSMILEHAPFGRRGYYASFTLQGVQAGQILAAAVFLPLATFMPEDMFNSWGWRIPFLLSAFVLVAGYIIRKEVHETPAFTSEERARRSAEVADQGSVRQQHARHDPRRLHGADERDSRRRDDLRCGICGAVFVWHRLSQERVSVDSGGRQHRRGAGDSVRRQPVGQDRPSPDDARTSSEQRRQRRGHRRAEADQHQADQQQSEEDREPGPVLDQQDHRECQTTRPTEPTHAIGLRPTRSESMPSSGISTSATAIMMIWRYC